MKTPLDFGYFATLLGGGVVGAAIGWVIAEVIIYQVFERPLEELYSTIEFEEEEAPKKKVNVAPPPPTKRDMEVKEQRKIAENYAERFKHGKLSSKSAADKERERKEMEDRDIYEEDEMDPMQEEEAASDGMEDFLTEEEYEEMQEEEGNNYDGFPYVITEEEWQESSYKKENLNYYDGDRILTDDQDNVIKHPEGMVGLRALHSFGEGTDDGDTVFIQDDNEQVVYEISRLYGRFDDMVIENRNPEPKPDAKRPARKRHKSKVKLDEEKAATRKLHSKMKAELEDENHKEIE